MSPYTQIDYLSYKSRQSLTITQHGRGGTSATQRDTSLYYDYTSASDYIIVYPQGLTGSASTSWQGPSYASPGVDDIEFVSDLLDYLEDNFCIDTNRVYASGKSNGGGFVDLLACSDVGDKFAAFAMAAAALYTDTSLTSCTKKRAILESHGLADPTIPYSGGQGLGGPLPNIDDWVGWWGTRDCGASSSATSSIEQREGYEVETISCDGGVQDVVKHFRLDSPAAHCWPNAQGDNYDSLRIPKGCGNARMLDFTEEVLEWFGRWELGSAPQSQ